MGTDEDVFSWVTRTQSRGALSVSGVQAWVDTKVSLLFCHIASVGRESIPDSSGVTSPPGCRGAIGSTNP